MLIREGAKIVLEPGDIIRELAPRFGGFMRQGAGRTAELFSDESGLCACLSREQRHIDAISREIRLPVNKILDILLTLELKGIVRQTEGKRFYLARDRHLDKEITAGPENDIHGLRYHRDRFRAAS